MSLLIDKHEKFFNRCLIALPSKLQSEDSNKLGLIYFCLHGLGLINRFKFSPPELEFYREFIYDSYLISNDEFQGFRATEYFARTNPEYDLPSVSATFFALVNLLILESDYSKRLDRHLVMNFVKRCQFTLGPNKGSFAPTLRYNEDTKQYEPYGETDLRICYVAIGIRKLLKYDESSQTNDINTTTATDFILDRLNHAGGFSSDKYTETHVGFTFCALASLKLLGYDLSQSKFGRTLDWLIHRQVDYTDNHDMTYDYYQVEDRGSYNGRDNKLGDTCYSWWCTGSIKLLGQSKLELTNLPMARDYLLKTTQNELLGGFAKDHEAPPDPFHTFMAVASLSLWNSLLPDNFQLQEIVEELVITKPLEQFLQAMEFS